ncbi:MAG: metallophosphoesterase [Phycisphaerales bacterium]|nr:metallophosphoesterase [Phycisphaerales bacterium]
MADSSTPIFRPPGRLSSGNGERRLSRRALLLGAASAVGCTALGGSYAALVEPFWEEWVSVRLDLPGLSPALVGRRILHLSDLHLSSPGEEAFALRVAEHCTRRQPDLIVLTGDFVTAGNPADIERVGRVAAALRARFGVFACLGNHDYYDYTRTLPRTLRYSGIIADRISAALRGGGVEVLRNATRVIQMDGAALQLVGLEDWMLGRFNADAAFARANEALPTIALSHNPDSIVELCRRPCHWVLSGHTHGGQVRLPWIGALRLPLENKRYDAGLFEENGRRMYVNRGLGHLMRVRFNCRPEVTEFTLASGAA